MFPSKQIEFMNTSVMNNYSKAKKYTCLYAHFGSFIHILLYSIQHVIIPKLAKCANRSTVFSYCWCNYISSI